MIDTNQSSKKMTTREEALGFVESRNLSGVKSIPSSIINKEIKYGRTLLYVACENGYFEIVQELLKCDGIDVNKGVSIFESQLNIMI